MIEFKESVVNFNMITRNIIRNTFQNVRYFCSSKGTIPITEPATLISETKHSGIITFNRPKVLNALNLEMIEIINKNLRRFEKTKSFVIVKGLPSGRSFSAGGDLPALLKINFEDIMFFFKFVYSTLYFISKSQTPNIAFIDGVAMGGGFAFSVLGKYSVATERTIMSMPEIAVGLFPDAGSSYFLNKLNGKLGYYLGMTGNRLIGEDVLRAGLATHFCKSSRLVELESELLKLTNSNDVPRVLDDFSMKISKNSGINLVMDKINTCFNAKTVEGILENLEKDGSKWALETINTLKGKCPLSLKLTLRQMQTGINKPLDECLKMEFRLAMRRVRDSDFKEGVRAIIVDKDNKPTWNLSSLDAVTDDMVLEYFKKLPENQELEF